ncbi:hypothetical protein KR067_007806 [Drosophila pandora]|nr:hypothetical protein KR067_007806 [Drosophila pandora]
MPDWYRGLSLSQMEAADNMSTALRDDMDQNTATRVAKLLCQLGLHPKAPWDTVITAVKLSRGNDLAFLWFLMELCYKSPDHGRTYCVNEQIILSAIFWLDLFPTLKELDRWLPLPHISQAERNRIEARRQKRLKLKKKREKERLEKELARKANTSKLAPYFEEPFQKKTPVRHLLSDYPDRPALLYEMPDEDNMSPLSTRWFGDYELSESRRVARTVINEEIGTMFCNFGKSLVGTDSMAKSIVNDEIKSIFDSFKAASLPVSDVETLCVHHRHLRDMEKSLKDQLEVLKSKRYEELIYGKSKAEERRKKLVIQELEEMSANYLKRFQEMAARTRLASTRTKLFGGGDVQGYTFGCPKVEKCAENAEECCQPCGKVLTEETVPEPVKKFQIKVRKSSSRLRVKGGAASKSKRRKQSRKKRSKSRSKSRPQRGSVKSINFDVVSILEKQKSKPKTDYKDIEVKLLKGENPIVPGFPDFRPEIADAAKVQTYDPYVGLPQRKVRNLKQRPSSLMQFLNRCGSEQDEEKEVPQNGTPCARAAQSRKIFELGPGGTSVVKFNYREIFGSLQTTRLDDERMRLKEAFVRAIDDDVQYLSAALSGEEEGSINAMVGRAAKRVFADDVKEFHKELERLRIKKEAEMAQKKHIRLDFGQKYYDPDNLPLMKEMLRLGLEKVGEDKRFVLPTLPDVQTVPYLLDWICYRYGKLYSQKAREKSYSEDKAAIEYMVRIMGRSLVKLPPPRAAEINEKDRKMIRKMAHCMKEQQTKKFLDSIMGISRVFYTAMRPQLCGATMKSTFYAYMPAHIHDLGFSINRNNI